MTKAKAWSQIWVFFLFNFLTSFKPLARVVISSSQYQLIPFPYIAISTNLISPLDFYNRSFWPSVHRAARLSVLFSLVAQSCLTLCDPVDFSTPGFLVHHQLLELAQTHVHLVSDTIQPFHPWSSHLLPPSVFSSESVLHIRWPKYWSFSFSISPSNEYSGLISLKIDWLNLLAVQGTLKSLLQHHSSKASILWRSAFFMVQLSSIHDYWKNHSFD